MTAPYYSADGITIYHADCRDIDDWDVAGGILVTDPPYGFGYRSGMGGHQGDCEIANDNDTEVRDYVLARWQPRPALVFGSWKVPHPAGTRMTLVWAKGDDQGMGDLSLPWKPNWEEIYVLGSGFVGARGGGVLQHQGMVNLRPRDHPTQKPISLMRDLLTKCPPLATVVDPFMGSGSTLAAARDMGREAIGCEVKEEYCEIAVRRLAQRSLFAELGPEGSMELELG